MSDETGSRAIEEAEIREALAARYWPPGFAEAAAAALLAALDATRAERDALRQDAELWRNHVAENERDEEEADNWYEANRAVRALPQAEREAAILAGAPGIMSDAEYANIGKTAATMPAFVRACLAKTAAEADRDRLAAEVERLTRERDEARDTAQEYAADAAAMAQPCRECADLRAENARLAAALATAQGELADEREVCQQTYDSMRQAYDERRRLAVLVLADERAASRRAYDSMRQAYDERDTAQEVAENREVENARLAAALAEEMQLPALHRRAEVAEAALAEVREAGAAMVPANQNGPEGYCVDRKKWWRFIDALVSTPADLAAARDARVRVEALRDAAERAESEARGMDDTGRAAVQIPNLRGVDGCTRAATTLRGFAAWLRVGADRIEAGK